MGYLYPFMFRLLNLKAEEKKIGNLEIGTFSSHPIKQMIL